MRRKRRSPCCLTVAPDLCKGTPHNHDDLFFALSQNFHRIRLFRTIKIVAIAFQAKICSQLCRFARKLRM